jgi:CheY-like chemotaxis protein
MKVLVVHRHEDVLEQICEQLGQWHVRSFSSGLDGLIACRMNQYDLILCSLDLPVVTGIELARSIRNFSLNKNTPIVLLAEGNETPEHYRIANLMDVNLLTLEEIGEMKNLVIE